MERIDDLDEQAKNEAKLGSNAFTILSNIEFL